tara:strand:- start:1120 stop:1692 length:573 start_codon:yes stop_codon:yes gene_type:complete
MIANKISILTMKSIFLNTGDEKCSVSSKMIYQSVLTHYFSDKITNIHLLTDFKMSKLELRFDKFEKDFFSLEKAELIKIFPDHIIFYDKWSKHLDLDQFGKAEYSRITANDVKDELYSSHSLNELIRMRYKVTIKKANDLLQAFLQEQDVINTKYANEGQVKKHFVYWCQGHINNNVSIESISKSKILGK